MISIAIFVSPICGIALYKEWSVSIDTCRPVILLVHCVGSLPFSHPDDGGSRSHISQAKQSRFLPPGSRDAGGAPDLAKLITLNKARSNVCLRMIIVYCLMNVYHFIQ